jgi:hypothetical protein
MQYKTENKDFILFKLPISSYNQILENLSHHLEDFNKKLNSTLENYNRIANNIISAIDLLNKQTVVDLDSINSLLASAKII